MWSEVCKSGLRILVGSDDMMHGGCGGGMVV